MTETLPRIAVVIIGVNVSSYIQACIESVRAANYPQELLEVIYVDGGSRDDSAARARACSGVRIIELRDQHPTPGRGRNAGWLVSDAPLIQFLDADTLIDPQWFTTALRHLSGTVGAVCGRRRERFPDKNIFHKLTDAEWHYEYGACRYFGGDVLVLREALEKTGGFDKTLIAGEDPELSYRIRHAGWQIIRIDAPMTMHDINMSRLRQYWRRAYRSGYAYAEIGLRLIGHKEKLWLRELARICVRAALPPMLVAAGAFAGSWTAGTVLAALALFRPFSRVPVFKKSFSLTLPQAFAYAAHASFVIYPQFFGALRYIAGRIFHRPLQNKGISCN
jgi:glycosyltransferase involved in cell wall biosynthesis